MSGETVVTIVGSLGGDPDLKFLPSGVAVASFTVASTPRSFDKDGGSWKDGETLWMRCTAWREMAESVAESLTRGSRVIVQGRLTQRSWEKDGQRRTSVELQVDEIGPSLRFATATVRKAARGGSSGGSSAPADDPWSNGSGEAPF